MTQASGPAKRSWTIIDLLRWGTTYLAEKGIGESRLTMELLLAHILHLRRIALYTNFEQPVDAGELEQLRALIRRRLTREPLQYILGTTEFMGLTFEVDASVLIPRPETELIAERAISSCRSLMAEEKSCRVLDVGTGSGCIAISCAKLAQGAIVTAIDKSEASLSVAKRNAALNGVAENIRFLRTDFALREDEIAGCPFEIVVSNPPYISRDEYARLDPEVREHEPPDALCDGGDGLSFYRLLAERSRSLLTDQGRAIVEHAYDQADAVLSIFSGRHWRVVEQFRDYAGHPRGAIFSRS